MSGDKLFVIKIGGNVVDDEDALSSFLKDFTSIQASKILVHGGGKIATRMGDRLGIESHYIDGRRITDEPTLDLVTMVYGGLVNKKIVARLQQAGCNAIGLTGADGNMIHAVKRPFKDIDYGWVGDIDNESVNRQLLKVLLQENMSPVFAPLSYADGHLLNTNADTIASVVGIAMSKIFDVRLIYCFEKKGVLADIRKEDSVIHHLTQSTYHDGLQSGSFHDGILPKLENAFEAIRQGIKEVIIGHHSDLVRNIGPSTGGTLITLE